MNRNFLPSRKHVGARQAWTRREALVGLGVGAASLASTGHWLAAGELAPPIDLTRTNSYGIPLAYSNGLEPKIKRVVFLNMTGGTPQMDLVDSKPALRLRDGKPLPPSVFTPNERFANVTPESKALGSPYRFKKYGDAAMTFSELLPNMSGLADRICMIHSMTSPEINHPAAQQLFQTGFPRPGRPSIGSWLTYALGTPSEDLPGFVLLQSGEGCECGRECSDSGFLPKQYQSVRLSTGDPAIFYLDNPQGISDDIRRQTIDAIADLNRIESRRFADPSIDSRTEMYRQVLRLQRSVPEATELADEPQRVLDAYGAKVGELSYAANCVLARRLLERGVRFVQLNHGDWDLHGKIFERLPDRAYEIDQGTTALVLDLEQSGLLDDTLVIWGTEFGRTPIAQGEDGRDHHKSFSIWLAGGGIKRAHIHGATDPFGFNVIESPVTPHDLQATILHLLGIDHEKLTYEHEGRRYRLTDIYGSVREELLA
ncbi:MAG: DUF1501 domain-containing protein [Planctomycetota bacterium]